MHKKHDLETLEGSGSLKRTLQISSGLTLHRSPSKGGKISLINGILACAR